MGTDTTSTRTSTWFAVLSGPIAWSVHETLTYVLVRPACSNGLLFVEYLLTLLALGVVGVGLFTAVRLQRDPAATARFLARTAILLNAVFGFAVIMETIPMTVVSPCL